jgi:hypothetical protein
MDEELKQVVKGFPYRVKSFTVYDVNGYRFHTRSHELSRPNQKTTNTGVRTPGTDDRDYYGIVKENTSSTLSFAEVISQSYSNAIGSIPMS